MLQRSAARSLVWIYLHIPLIMSIVAMGAALEDTLRMVKASAVLNTAFLQLSWGLGMLLVAAIAALGLEQPTLASKKLAIILGALAGLLSVALVLLDVRLSPIATLIILACIGLALSLLDRWSVSRAEITMTQEGGATVTSPRDPPET